MEQSRTLTDDFAARSLRGRLALSLGTLTIYALAFLPLYNLIWRAVVTLAIVPVILGATIFGLWGGIVASLVIFPVNIVLLLLAGEEIDYLFAVNNFWAIQLVFIAVGSTVGYLQRLRSQFYNERREHHRTGEALRETEERFRALLDSASVGVIAVDHAGRIMLSNRMIEGMFQYDRAELMGQSLEMLLPERFHSAHSDHRAGFFANPATRSMGLKHQLIGRRKQGEDFPVEVGLSHFKIRGETHAVAFVTDITVRKQVEEEREGLIEDLDAFAHTVAHDLKNPLGTIRGYADLLVSDLNEGEEREFAQMIVSGADKMNDIILSLLLLAGVRTLEEVPANPLDMHAIVADAQRQLALMIQEHKAEVVLPGNWPQVVGYSPWIEGVWTNYVSNAIKYGGNPPRIELGADSQSDGIVRFWVRDNGSGLTEEEQARLFTPFTRMEQANIEGHGLGLSIVKRVLEKLGGEVGVESRLGAGSTFWFTLPAAED
jgi:PAS domain S-box-containing protein